VVSTFTRSRWIAVAVMTATFLAGAMLGFAVQRIFASEPPAQAERAPRQEHEDRRDRPSILDKLDLTPAQEARRDSILEKRRREMNAFWEQHGPAMRAIVDSTRAEIDRMLTPEQRAQMEAFREKRKRDGGGERTGGSGRL
jgi:Spy/CpxP family protein refolding chaperone